MSVPRPDPIAIVIFGASGDLARRKLLPALFHLHVEGLLPERVAVVGVARTAMDDDAWRALAREAADEFCRCEVKDEAWGAFARHLHYEAGGASEPGGLAALRSRLDAVEAEEGTGGRRLFYCATPPLAFGDIVGALGETGLHENAAIVIEKPFGTDLESARALNAVMHRVFREEQVFRIDHYLGKETVQNVLALRFANAMFEPIWNRRYVDHVQLTVAEAIGIEGRGRFYERTGTLRDMVQTHLLQVLTFLAMEPPTAFEARSLVAEKAKVLRSIPPVRPQDVVRGQYRGYRDEPDVASDSSVETFVALRLEIDSWRWAGVPFYLRTGKSMREKRAEATVRFRDVPHRVFESAGVGEVEPNRLTIRIQPDEGITIRFAVQRPGVEFVLDRGTLEFDYGEAFPTPLVEAYEVLLLEAMRGDRTLFTSEEGVERAWEILAPVLEAPPPVHGYEPGTWGPVAADELIAPRSWYVC